jgi:hypothetical protein
MAGPRSALVESIWARSVRALTEDCAVEAPTPSRRLEGAATNDRLNFRVYAGRRRTGSVANTFNDRTTERVATRREKASGGPSELNFTFSGTLTLNGDQFPNFNIGQGSKGGGIGTDSNNNWWVGVASGGQTAVNNGDAFLCITGPTGSIYQITLPGDDSFRLRVRALGEGEVCGT